MDKVDGPVRAKKCKLPLKYILRCCNPSIAKIASQLEVELTEESFAITIIATAGFSRKFHFNVLETEELTSKVDKTRDNHLFECPVSVLEGECNTFPKTVTEVCLSIENDKLVFTSHKGNAGAIKNVETTVAIPVTNTITISHHTEGVLTFTLREFLATVEVWEDLVGPEQLIKIYNQGAGKPLILNIDTAEIESTLITATMQTIVHGDSIRELSKQSFIVKDEPIQGKKRRLENMNGNDRKRINRSEIEEPVAESTRVQLQPPEPRFKKPELQSKSNLGEYLLGLDSDSDQSEDEDLCKTMELLGEKTGNEVGKTLLGLNGTSDSIIPNTQSQNKAPRILCYDSD